MAASTSLCPHTLRNRGNYRLQLCECNYTLTENYQDVFRLISHLKIFKYQYEFMCPAMIIVLIKLIKIFAKGALDYIIK